MRWKQDLNQSLLFSGREVLTARPAGEAWVDWRVSENGLSTHLSCTWSEAVGSLCVYDLLRGG